VQEKGLTLYLSGFKTLVELGVKIGKKRIGRAGESTKTIENS